MLSLKSEIQLLFFHTSWPVLNFEIGKIKQDWPQVSNFSCSFANYIHVKCEYFTPLAYIGPTACMYHLQSNVSEISTCNNTAPRRPTYGTPADRGPMDISHGISVFL